ncbi:MAG TPA: ABC transporter permease [Solirubrobacteraceae bacterium]|nr:ABC transporter permease [Solirubrobacteraceae bacterium]
MTTGTDTTTAGTEDTPSPSRSGAARILGGRVQALGQGRWRAAGIVFPFLILFVVLTIASSSFATKANLLNILDQQSATLIIAAAGTLVLVSGGIDLSVGSIYGLSGVVAAELALHNWPAGLAVLVGVLVGFAAGLINGVVATYFRISALIATLAMSFVLAGLGSLITQGNLLNLFTHQSFSDLTRTSIFTVDSSIWLAVVAVIALGLFLARSTIGRYMYAAGGNPEAARIAGVRVNVVKVISFSLSGAAAGLAGVIDASRVLSAQSQDNSSLTFTVLAGIVVGGTSILGGEGAVWRTVVGVLFIALIGNGYDLLGLNPLYEQMTLGVLMILAVGLDAWSRGRAA